MRERTTLILCAVAILLMLAAAQWAGLPERRGEPDPGRVMFPDLATRMADIDHLDVSGRGQQTHLVRDGGTWRVVERDQAPADPKRVRDVLESLAGLRLAEPRTADPARLSRLDLDDPARNGSHAVLVRALSGEERLASLVVGKRRPDPAGLGASYVRAPDDSQAWLAGGIVPASPAPPDWLPADVISLPAQELSRIDSGALHLVRDADHWTLVGDARPLDPYRLDAVTHALEHLPLLDTRRAEHLGAQHLGAQHLGDSEFTTTTGLVAKIAVLADKEATWVTIGLRNAAAESPEAALAARLDGWAFRVPGERRGALLPAPESLHAYGAASR